MTAAVRDVRWALATLLLAAIAGCGAPPSEDPKVLIAKAQAHREKHDYQAAIIELKNVLQQDPYHAEARYLLGRELLDSGDARSAESELRRAMKLGADPVETFDQLGKSLLMQAKFKEVLEETDPARMASAGESAEILSVRGLAQLFLQRPAEARQSFEQALALRPDSVDALLGQARVAAGEKKVEEADKLIERALAADAKSVEAWIMKGDLKRAAGDQKGALGAYQKVVELRGDHVSARLNIASLQIAEGNFDEARQQIEQVRKRAPNSPMANYLQALIEFRKHNFPAAREALQQVLRVAPAYMPAVLLAGALEYQQGAQGQAQLHLARVVDHTPDNLYARKLLVASLAKSGQLHRALDALQTGLKQAPTDAALIALAGELYMQNNEPAKAIEFFEKAVKLDPGNAATRTGLGLSRLASGETDHGMADLESAVRLDSATYQADIMLVMSHLRRENFDDALKAMAGLEKKQPDNPLTHNLNAAIHIGRKDVPTARKHLERALELQPTYVAAAMNLARLDFEAQKPQDARRRFETILDKDRNNVQALLALANLSPRIDATQKEQIDWLERAREASPASVQPQLMLARLYADAGDPRKALEVAQRAHAGSPDNPETLSMLGAMQIAAGEKHLALATYRRLATLQPKSPVAHYRLASAQIASADPAAASTLQRAIALKPDFTEAQIALVELEARAGRYSEALKVAEQVQSQAPKTALGHILEGDVMVAQKKFAHAAKAYETAYGLGKTGLLTIKLHAAYAKAGRVREADARLEQWLKESPEDGAVRLYAAETRLKSGEYKGAIEHYERLVRAQPDDMLLLNNLAWAYQQVKDPRALETIERAYKREPDNAAVADTLGWILVEQGHLGRGLELLQKAVAAAPDAHEIRYHLAHALAQLGDKAQAIMHLERIVPADEKFAQRTNALALLKQLKN